MAIAQALARLWTFHGGLHLDDHKAESAQGPVIRAPLPKQFVLPLQQHIGAPAKAVVQIGQSVGKGQLLARADGHISASLHAPSSGTVAAVEDRPVAHPSALAAPCIVLDTDGRDAWGGLPAPLTPYRDLDPRVLRQRVGEAGIVGLGGAAFPSAVKLDPGSDRPIDRLILNGAECEPYITCDDRLMRDRPREVIGGLLIMAHALQAKDAVIGVEDNKPEAFAALTQALAELGGAAGNVSLRQVPTLYPSGGERQLIRMLTGHEVPSRGLPADIGIVCHNVATAVAVFEAVMEGRPLISRYITVTGQGVRRPAVLEAPIGTPIRELIRCCGGYTDQMARLILGGPMMGFTLPNDGVPVVKGSNCILAAGHQELAPIGPALPCIRCGACAEVCPADLLPQQLYWHARGRDFDQARNYHLLDCIECGCCAAVCPSRIPLVQYYRFAKTELQVRERERQKADLARRRHEFHQARLAREKQEKEDRLRRRKEALQPQAPEPGRQDPKKAAIEAAVARAKAKKAAAETAQEQDTPP